jgi:hypothetical protein
LFARRRLITRIVSARGVMTAALAVILPRVLDGNGGVEVHVSKPIESNPAVATVPRTLGRIELEHDYYIVYTIKMYRAAFRRAKIIDISTLSKRTV